MQVPAKNAMHTSPRAPMSNRPPTQHVYVRTARGRQVTWRRTRATGLSAEVSVGRRRTAA